ncbi:MAG: hypothetical protein QNJ31_03315 [Candidatus Caenarcaniphilales bacterium]|nr:hypothetical protein [Candidatus Caenarcaniphilales bacterium]
MPRINPVAKVPLYLKTYFQNPQALSIEELNNQRDLVLRLRSTCLAINSISAIACKGLLKDTLHSSPLISDKIKVAILSTTLPVSIISGLVFFHSLCKGRKIKIELSKRFLD